MSRLLFRIAIFLTAYGNISKPYVIDHFKNLLAYILLYVNIAIKVLLLRCKLLVVYNSYIAHCSALYTGLLVSMD